MVTYSSTYVLVALSIDRYDAITHPMNFSTSGEFAAWVRLHVCVGVCRCACVCVRKCVRV